MCTTVKRKTETNVLFCVTIYSSLINKLATISFAIRCGWISLGFGVKTTFAFFWRIKPLLQIVNIEINYTTGNHHFYKHQNEGIIVIKVVWQGSFFAKAISFVLCFCISATSFLRSLPCSNNVTVERGETNAFSHGQLSNYLCGFTVAILWLQQNSRRQQ